MEAKRVPRYRASWRYDWVLDIDVKGYFDSIDWELMLKAVRRHTDCPWVLLYIERWLKAPVQMEDGSVVPRTAGTPQGGVISPILANLFLHYAFDTWMARSFPRHPVRAVRGRRNLSLQERRGGAGIRGRAGRPLRGCGLVLHPEKTKIVYCKDANRRGDFPNQSFDFLGYSVSEPRKTMWQGRLSPRMASCPRPVQKR